MTYELKQFFKRLEDANDSNYFLLKKFYYSPKSILNKTEQEVFSDELLIKNYLNDDFFSFLTLAIDDETFLNRLDYNMAYNLLSFFEKLHELTLYKNEKICKRLIILLKKHIGNDLLYRVLDFIIEKKDIILQLKVKISCISWSKYTNEVKPLEIKEKIIQDIIKYNPNDSNNPLKGSEYYSDNIILSLGCENRFLDIIEFNFLNKNLDDFVIDNIINILSSSIRIKTMGYKNIFEIYAREKLDINLIKEFDIKRAQKLVSELTFKKNQQNKKIVYFPTK